MKFHLAINLERSDPSTDMQAVRDHTLSMVQTADQHGFEIAWAAEHHAIEMTIAPNPFQILTWWAGETNNIRLGCGVANAAYWHPINLAGEAAFLDLISGGRLEFGIGSGAYQREFDRMKPGLKQPDSWRYMQEMLPAVRKLWAGDYEHQGMYWEFPTSTSVPKPLQSSPPVWVAARSPITFDYAVDNNCNVMSWPLTRPFSEAELYKQQLDEAIKKKRDQAPSTTGQPGNTTDVYTPVFSMMRHTAVYDNETERSNALTSLRHTLAQFGNLMRGTGTISNGFADKVTDEELDKHEMYDTDLLETNLMFGSPEQVIDKLKRYESIGVDAFIYYASMNLNHDSQKKSLELFCKEVMPEFT